MNKTNSAERFSSRVENYIKYRPRYPKELIAYLKQNGNFNKDQIVADIGSGTGILTKLFLENGNPVFGIEPNNKMQAAGEKYLSNYSRFTSITGTSEETTLQDQSVDWVVAGQAYHWFDRVKTKEEFNRILRPSGSVLLIWNSQDTTHPVMQEYMAIVDKYGTDFKQVSKTAIDISTDIKNFFDPAPITYHKLDNQQILDYQGLIGRVLSSSYAPLEDHPDHKPMLIQLKELFEKYQSNQKITLPYITDIYWGIFN